jgi:hypothetical protein
VWIDGSTKLYKYYEEDEVDKEKRCNVWCDKTKGIWEVMFDDKMIQRWEGKGKLSKVQDTQHKDFAFVILLVWYKEEDGWGWAVS